MKIWLFPIEPLTERYSEQWYRWFPEEIRSLGATVEVVDGQRIATNIETGQFLDVHDTHFYKASQLQTFIVMSKLGAVKDGDWVLLLDGWNPAVTALDYIRSFGKTKFKIAGLFHAGSYDPWDMLAQEPKFAEGAARCEEGWIAALDRVFVATNFHRMLLIETRGGGDSIPKIKTTGFPLRANEWSAHARAWRQRERVVVFPHRLAAEKDPARFDMIRELYQETYPDDRVHWVRTKDAVKTKADYYNLLGQARVAVSTAHQETWGIAMLEAASLGCHPVVPPRLSYPEIYPPSAVYWNLKEAVESIRAGLDAAKPFDYEGARWESAIENMLKEMKGA